MKFDNPLENVRIAAPCKADWEQMVGTERARFCAQCNLNVYNLSSMTRAEAEHLIANNEGRLCVRYYRRADGSILTANCPVGLRAIRRQLSIVSRAVTSAVLSFLAGLGLYGLVAREERRPPELMGVISVAPPIKIPAYTPPPPLVEVEYSPEVGRLMLKPQIIRAETPRLLPLKVTRRPRRVTQ